MICYRASKKRFDEDEEFKTRSREAVTRLQSGDEEFLRAWRRICDASRQEFQKIYDRLGVSLEARSPERAKAASETLMETKQQA